MLIRNHLQKLKLADEHKCNDLDKVIKSQLEKAPHAFRFLHKERSRINPDLYELTQDLCANDDCENELLKIEFSSIIQQPQGEDGNTTPDQIMTPPPESSLPNDLAHDNTVVSPRSGFPTSMQDTSLLKDNEELMTLMSSYCAAYFNLGTCFEHLRQFDVSVQAF